VSAAPPRPFRRGAAGWPERLEALSDPPATLFLRGDAGLLQARAVAIVGTRECSPEGWDWTHRAAGRLAEAGLVVVSGLARGIDAAAHRGALDAAGETVAVLGCGPDVAYPEENAELLERVAANGLVLSELPPGTEPRPWHFPRRNRLLAALSVAVVVVEARLRSGALVTARLALDLGREVFVVPGWPTSALSAGPLALLRDGARAIRGAEDLLEDLGGIAGEPPPDPEHADALAAVREGAAGPEELARALSIDAAQARERWAALEMLGRVPPARRP
jgi:DNA processing protein